MKSPLKDVERWVPSKKTKYTALNGIRVGDVLHKFYFRANGNIHRTLKVTGFWYNGNGLYVDEYNQDGSLHRTNLMEGLDKIESSSAVSSGSGLSVILKDDDPKKAAVVCVGYLDGLIDNHVKQVTKLKCKKQVLIDFVEKIGKE